MANETLQPNATPASPVARMTVKAIKEGTYAERWRKVLVCEPTDVNDVHVVEGPIVVAAELFPQAKVNDVLEFSVKASAKK